MIDEQKLRELAEAATPGPWVSAGPSFGAEFPVYCNEVVVNRPGDEDDTYGICQAPTCLEEESTHDMDYIAAVDPQTIRALLDELATLRSERTTLLVNEQNLREELEALRASLGEPVAVIGRDYQLLWARRDWSEGLNVGVNLYALSNKETP